MSENILSLFAEKLSLAGLQVERVEADGLLHRCGTDGKPNGSDGSYKAFSDSPASLWWKNWRTGDEGTWSAKADAEMSAAEREALQERIRQAREEREREAVERYARAAEEAESLWASAYPAPDEHPYLKRKGVPALGLKLTHDSKLIVPVLDEHGNAQSLQFILPDGGKRFLPDGKVEGGFFPIPAKDGGKSGTLLIAEGYATGASLHQATGHSVLVAFNAGNLPHVAKLARRLYQEREIILCADNDTETKKQDGTPWNPGVEYAAVAAQIIGAKLAVCPAHEGRPTDFNDLHQWRGLEAVRRVVEAAGSPAHHKPCLRVVDIQELLSLNVPPRRHILYPVIPEQGLCMLFAERGVGKTFVGLHASYAVATGGDLFSWKAEIPRPVLYIDGEMPFSAIQERVAAIVAGTASEPPDPSFLRILTPDLQGDTLMPNLATKQGQEAVEPFLTGVKLVVVDNLATLARIGRSNDEESWTPVQEWVLSLRRRGLSVLLVHHASKNGSQRGTSAKEDVLDTVIQLRRPHDYETEQGARFEVHLTKARGIFGTDAEPFEAKLTSAEGISSWTVKTLESSLLEQIRALADEGLTMREIAEELGASKSKVGRLCREHGIDTKGGRK